MTSLLELSKKFSIPGVVGFEKLTNNIIDLTVSNQYADARICLYGGQITRFKPKNEPDILWMSPKSKYEVGKAIRGGIPVCFPWFGPHKTEPEKPQHGFGRLMFWDLTETSILSNGETLVRLELRSSEATISYWPYDFIAGINVIIGKTLHATLKVTNTSSTHFEYTCALHSYYNISDIEAITIDGLGGTGYYKHGEPGDFKQDSSFLEIHQSVDRHYHDTEAACTISDSPFCRKIVVDKSGSKVTTVWNPWADGSVKMSDMPDDAYKTFVCVEAVNSFEDAINLKPGESHETSVIIGMEK